MCQLTLSHFKDGDLNALFTLIQSLENTRTTHQDGFGFFNGKDFRKWELAPPNIINLQEIVTGGITGTAPVFSHVRRATLTNGKRVVSNEKSHPFKSDDIFLAHNGSLELKDEKEMEDKKFEGMIDTEIFLHFLQEEYKKHKTLYPALKEVMELFYGKFAFMIYSTKEKKYYIVRGRTADLHFSKVHIDKKPEEVLGIVINTESRDLEKGLVQFCQLAKFIRPKLKINFSEIENLKSETVWELDELKLKEVGELKENIKPTVVRTFHSQAQNRGRFPAIPVSGNKQFYPLTMLASPEEEEIFRRVKTEMYVASLTNSEFDELCFQVLNVPVLYLTEEDAEIMLDWILPALTNKAEKNKRKSNLWNNSGGAVWSKYETGIQFPWMLNTLDDLRENLKPFILNEETEK